MRTADDFQITDQEKKSYKFKMDGKGYPDAYGATVTWKQINDHEWDAAYVMDGKKFTTEHYALSTDGKTLTSRSTIQTDHGPSDQSITMRRADQGTGLLGRWNGQLQLTPFVLEITPRPNDGLLFRIGGVMETQAKFDGKPYPVSGPLAQKGSTSSFTRIDGRSFKTRQIDPSVTLDATVTVSADGKTLTEIGKMTSGTTRKWVFERQ